ncbi:hypothetical protein BV25DRAFT_1692852 [Artomyces pyxidatus]|uniref:Uncharacterized protein n=1 Tax=Artomyces pyxidatus TaxID=48021 RepID=A0ACB8TAD0_9AGAM|nr:hypothetical protein BV25DRAFT_1692852 [Artomyces pyxidatus]
MSTPSWYAMHLGLPNSFQVNPALTASTVLYLTRGKADWLSGRLVLVIPRCFNDIQLIFSRRTHWSTSYVSPEVGQMRWTRRMDPWDIGLHQRLKGSKHSFQQRDFSADGDLLYWAPYASYAVQFHRIPHKL